MSQRYSRITFSASKHQALTLFRFGTSSLHQRDPRSALFDGYTGDRSRPGSQSPARYNGGGGGGYGYTGASGSGGFNEGFRSATPNKKGQYSDAVLSELESQNDEQVQGMSARVKMLKNITVAIGDEIRDSSKLAETMENSFDNTRVRLRGTMNRMLRMAEKTGVGWRIWLMFFAAVAFLFWYVWLF
ncbi:MAG: protein transport protein bet1 [Stictis urceolatum]|nr:protein transport protein bet1 [Stictis urceolata]